MNRQAILGAVLIAALVIVAAGMVAAGAYNAGVAHGIAEGGHALAPAPGALPYVYVWPRPWGFGFFPVFPLFFLFLLFFLVRRSLWRGPWRGGWTYRYDGVPPMFDEWHRRAHEGARQEPRAPENRV
jgi:hypothetical protein